MSITRTNVNIFLSSKTPGELVELQIINNLVNNVRYNYQTPIYDGNNWFIWFFADIDTWINPNELDKKAIKLAKGEL